ncbi:hypothetical protein GCM10009785_09940 [Brooklawnia cerclae]
MGVVNGLVASVGAGVLVLGLFLVVTGSAAGRRVPRPGAGHGPVSMWRRTTPRARLQLLTGACLGVVVAFVTGFVPAVVVVPVVVALVPELLRTPPQSEVRMLEALDRWIRALAASVSTGKSVTDAIRATRGQVPTVLAAPVHDLVVRLDERWSLRDAVQAMADEVDSADADGVLAALILVGERGGIGASATLEVLGAGLQDRMRAAREVAGERAKPQVVVRQVTGITVVVVAAAVVVSPGYFAPFGTPLGQGLLLVLCAAYLGSLAALRRIATPRRRDRVLVRLFDAEATRG